MRDGHGTPQYDDICGTGTSIPIHLNLLTSINSNKSLTLLFCTINYLQLGHFLCASFRTRADIQIEQIKIDFNSRMHYEQNDIKQKKVFNKIILLQY